MARCSSLLFVLVLGAQRLSAQTGTVTGRVVDSTTSRPVATAQVEVVRDGAHVVARAVSASDGRFAISAIQPGAYEILVKAIGYSPARLAGVSVGTSDPAAVTIPLSALGVLLNPEVVSVSRTAESTVDAPASVTVISAREIEQRPTTTAIEQTRDAPGVDIASTGIIQSHIVTRGFNGVYSGALLVLTDNRFDFLPSLRINTPWLMPDLNSDIERIEIVLGPGAALYGPNATSGVVQIFTKRPRDWPGTTVGVSGFGRSGNPTGGAGGARQLTLRHAATVGSRFGYKVTAQYLKGTDWPELDSAEIATRRDRLSHGADPETDRVGVRDFSVERWTAEARADYQANERTELSLATGRAQAGSAIDLTGFGAVQVRDWSYAYYQARLTNADWFAQAFMNVNGAGGSYLLRSGDGVVDHSRVYAAQLQHTSNVGARQTLVYGLDALRTDPRTGGTRNGRNEDDDQIDELGGYLQSETHLTPRVDLVAAARLDGNSRLPSAIFSPRAAIVVKPSDSHTWRLSFNRAFETPTTDNLFLDYVPRSLPIVPYNVRVIGVPTSGLAFRHDCNGGLCMRSTLGESPDLVLSTDGTLVWKKLVEGLNAFAIADLRNIPAPSSADVRSTLRLLNIADEAHPHFDPVSANDVHDIRRLRERVVTTLETGYKGIFGEVLRLGFDVYYETRNNFVAAPIVETPNVFFEAGQVGQAGTLANYLARYMPADTAAKLANFIGGVAGSPILTGVPLGTVSPEGPLAGSTDLLITFRNSGTLHRWGADAGVQWLPTQQWTLTGAFSWTNKDMFRAAETGGYSDLALNAPPHRASLGVTHRDRARGLTTYLRGRYVAGFPMLSGVYIGDVPAYTTLDGGLAYRLPNHERLLVTVNAQNLLGNMHREFIGAPMLGRMIVAQLQYSIP
jgi:iron complex outermembrane receptor protein